ncbi:DUF1826 domain-containing protein [Neptunomonas antarctica]|uniref:Succinylglutamate desuccinylase n=1 Tax=Neptunomonas antarctica TaxID=619304 RepID=A0A1N7JA46_9GAMM|nr:DUF1826 domain-containing protein [Neptunomonas antarctica]SIS46229.1 Protein of unknown function [Neptunomonas antarctica]
MNALSTHMDHLTAVDLFRSSATGKSHQILTDIYRDDVNMVIWQRDLCDALVLAAHQIMETKPTLKVAMAVTPSDACSAIYTALGSTEYAQTLSEDIAQLVDMFCCLFGLKRAGLRLVALDRAMCPRFHVDKVPSRLMTTYQGIATEWLPNHPLDRSKLGAGNDGKPDEQSGLFGTNDDIQQLTKGDVALLKGEGWLGNQGAGLVHRSPHLSDKKRRLLLTLDFIDD